MGDPLRSGPRADDGEAGKRMGDAGDKSGGGDYGDYLADLMNLGGSEEESTLPPLLGGVEEGYSIEVQVPFGGNTGGPYDIVAEYRYGDELGEAGLGGRTTTQISRIQETLASVGFLAGTYADGVYDDKTATAWARVLGLSNRSGQSPAVIMRQLGQAGVRNGAASGGSGGGASGTVLQVPNASDLKRMFRSVAVSATGSSAHGLDVDGMVSSFQGQIESYQQAQIAAAKSGQTVTLEQPQSAESFVQTELEEKAPVKVQTNNMVERAGHFLSMISGGQI